MVNFPSSVTLGVASGMLTASWSAVPEPPGYFNTYVVEYSENGGNAWPNATGGPPTSQLSLIIPATPGATVIVRVKTVQTNMDTGVESYSSFSTPSTSAVAPTPPEGGGGGGTDPGAGGGGGGGGTDPGAGGGGGGEQPPPPAPTKLATPSGISLSPAVPNFLTMQASWGSVANASTYMVEYTYDGSNWFAAGQPAAGTTSQFTVPYAFALAARVTAFPSSGSYIASDPSAVSSYVAPLENPGLVKLGTPTGVTLSSNATTALTMDVSWSAVTDADMYVVQYTTNGSAWSPAGQASAPATSVSFVVPNTTPVAVRIVAIPAVSNTTRTASSASAISNYITPLTSLSSQKLATPVVSLAASTTESLTLIASGYAAANAGVFGVIYKLEYSMLGGAWVTVSSIIDSPTHEFTVPQNNSVVVRVTALATADYQASDPGISNQRTARVKHTTPVDVTSIATGRAGEIRTSWAFVPNAMYRIEQSVDGVNYANAGVTGFGASSYTIFGLTGSRYIRVKRVARTNDEYYFDSEYALSQSNPVSPTAYPNVPRLSEVADVAVAKGTTPLTLNVTWSDTVNSDCKYRVEYSVEAGIWIIASSEVIASPFVLALNSAVATSVRVTVLPSETNTTKIESFPSGEATETPNTPPSIPNVSSLSQIAKALNQSSFAATTKPVNMKTAVEEMVAASPAGVFEKVAAVGSADVLTPTQFMTVMNKAADVPDLANYKSTFITAAAAPDIPVQISAATLSSVGGPSILYMTNPGTYQFVENGTIVGDVVATAGASSTDPFTYVVRAISATTGSLAVITGTNGVYDIGTKSYAYITGGSLIWAAVSTGMTAGVPTVTSTTLTYAISDSSLSAGTYPAILTGTATPAVPSVGGSSTTTSGALSSTGRGSTSGTMTGGSTSVGTSSSAITGTYNASTGTMVFSGLTPSTTYDITISGNGYTPISGTGTTSAVTATTLGTITMTQEATSVTLSVPAATGVSSYYWQTATYTNGSWGPWLVIAGSNSRTVPIDNTDSASYFKYRVQGEVTNGSGYSAPAPSSEVYILTQNAVTGLALTPGAGSISASWTAAVKTDVHQAVASASSASYLVDLYQGASTTPTQTKTVTGTSTSFTGLTASTAYTVKVVTTTTDTSTIVYYDSAPATASTSTTAAAPAPAAICFLADAPVLTPAGYRPISTIEVGDLVRTAAGLTVAVKRVFAKEYTAGPAVNPFVIPKGSFGALRSLPISPNHEVMTVKGMVKAKDLGLKRMKMAGDFTYYNLELEDWVRDNLVVAGVECESLAPAARITMTKAEFGRFVKARYGPAAAARLRTVCFEETDGSVSMPAFK